jgi:hypothetical protein
MPAIQLDADWSAFARDWGVDPDRAQMEPLTGGLINANYLLTTPAERDVLPGLLMASTGADGCEFVTGVWHREAFVDGVADSYSVTTFLSLLADPGWQTRVQAACVVEKQS